MKYQQGEVCTRNDLAALLKRILSDLVAGNLVVEGQQVDLPQVAELDVKEKFTTGEEGGSLVIKVSWDNPDFVTHEEEII